MKRRASSKALVVAFGLVVPLLSRIHAFTCEERFLRSRRRIARKPGDPSVAVGREERSKREVEAGEGGSEKREGDPVKKRVSWSECMRVVSSAKLRSQLLQVGHASLALLATFLTAVLVLHSLTHLSTHHLERVA